MGVPSNMANNAVNEELAADQQQVLLNNQYNQQTAALQSQYNAQNAQLDAAINPATPAASNNPSIGAYAGAASPGNSYLGNTSVSGFLGS
jgi:hypothetical protein